MSSWKVEVVPVALEKHPNADTLSVARVRGWTCVVKTSDFEGVPLGAYIPVESIVPDAPAWAFLKGHRRIKTAKLRGIVSQGLLIPARPHWRLGDDVSQELGIVKYDPPEPIQMGGEDEPSPALFLKYTDIENWKDFPDVIREGEVVAVTEKIHGTSWRAAVIDGRLYVGAHRSAKKLDAENLYWKAALRYEVERKLRAWTAARDGVWILYGEIFGRVQDLHYGLDQGFDLRLFDISRDGRYLDHGAFTAGCDELGLPRVPVLHVGPFNEALLRLADGPAFQGGHMREGVVIRPTVERWDDRLGRVILKRVSDEYLLRRKGTEFH